MTPLVWATIALCAVVASLIVGIPYWITFARPGDAPDHSEAWAYLAAKERADERVVPGADRAGRAAPLGRHRADRASEDCGGGARPPGGLTTQAPCPAVQTAGQGAPVWAHPRGRTRVITPGR